MRFVTACIHAGNGYLPDTLKVEAHNPNVEGYGYNDDYDDHDSDVVIETDNLDAAYALWLEYAVGCSDIRGADDDHYDYFPSNFDALVALGKQIDSARGNGRCMFISRFIWDQLARHRDIGKSREEAIAEFADEIVSRP